MDVTTGSSVFPTSLFYQLIPPREVLRNNLAPYRQYQRTTTITPAYIYLLTYKRSSTVKLLSGRVVLSLTCRYQYSSVIVSFSLVRRAISTHSGSARFIGRSPNTALVASRTSTRSGSDRLNQSDDASCLERVAVRAPSRDCTTTCTNL